MPTLDFAILADHVRAENGLGYVIAGGIDEVRLQNVPAGINAGVLARLHLTPAERSRNHRVEVIFQDEDGQRLVQVSAVTDPLEGAGEYIMLGLNFGLPIPRYGRYSLEIIVNDTNLKTIALKAPDPAGLGL